MASAERETAGGVLRAGACAGSTGAERSHEHGGTGDRDRGAAVQPYAVSLHAVYSNWEWGTVCFSESYESLAEGVETALWEVGGVPREHRTDSLSAAVKPPSSKDEFTEKDNGRLGHERVRASQSRPGRGHEKCDV